MTGNEIWTRASNLSPSCNWACTCLITSAISLTLQCSCLLICDFSTSLKQGCKERCHKGSCQLDMSTERSMTKMHNVQMQLISILCSHMKSLCSLSIIPNNPMHTSGEKKKNNTLESSENVSVYWEHAFSWIVCFCLSKLLYSHYICYHDLTYKKYLLPYPHWKEAIVGGQMKCSTKDISMCLRHV